MRPLLKFINLSALRHNLAWLQKLAAPAQLMVVVKADAYGHGVANVLPALESAAQLAVASIDEALVLRAHGARQTIVLLEGVFSEDELALCADNDFVAMVHNKRQLQWLAQHDDLALKVWLKIDSGMHRLGFAAEDISHAMQVLQGLAHVDCLGLATHLACADAQDLTHAQAQMAFADGIDIPASWQRCYANSAGLLQLPQARADWVRVGLALYGISPMAHQSAAELGLQPVMTLRSEVLAVHHIRARDTAGYSQGFYAPQDGYLATIALGYGDGFPHRIDNGAVQVKIGAKTYPIVGRVAMDMALVWLAEDCYPIGEAVIVWGDGHDIEVVAEAAQTIPYTLTTSLTARVRSQLIEDDNGKG